MAIDRKPNSLEVRRAVEFFVIRQRSADHPAINLANLMSDMRNLQMAHRGEKLENGETFLYWLERGRISTSVFGLRIGITRTKAQSGKYSKLDHKWKSFGMTEDEEQTEVSHMLIFPNNVVAFEYNPFGPRLSQLTWYLSQRFSQHGRVGFDTCAKQQIKKKLENFSHVTKASFTVTPANLELYGHLLGDDFEQSRRKELADTGADTITIEIKVSTRRKQHGDIAGVVILSQPICSQWQIRKRSSRKRRQAFTRRTCALCTGT